MRQPTFFPKPIKSNYDFQQGVSIVTKVKRCLGNKDKRILENKEPITDGAPIIYTNRDDGVVPAYNIRTDRWDIAQEAMDAVNQQRIAKSKNFGVKTEEKPEEGLETGTETKEPA